MPIPLPDLDDRRWSDLVDQGRALIPLHAPEWTDHNASDPGITLMEMFASVAEMDIYRLNRLTRAQRLRMLALLDARPAPPRPAVWAAALTDLAAPGTPPATLPAGSEFSGTLLDGRTVLLAGQGAIDIAAAGLHAVMRDDGGVYRDLSAAWQRGEGIALFGDAPMPGTACCLGFDAALPAGRWTQLYIAVEGGQAAPGELARVRARDGAGEPLRHHGVRLAWEMLDETGWSPLEAADGTRAFSLAGCVRLRPARPTRAVALGRSAQPRHWIRCRLAGGSFDAPPRVTAVLVNGIELVQAVPATTSWPIARGTVAAGTPVPGQAAALHMTVREGTITALSVDSSAGPAGIPGVTVLAYTAASATAAGSLAIEGILAGIGNAEPCQRFTLDGRPVVEAGVRLLGVDASGLREWVRVDDFTASTRKDAHFQLDATAATVQFGDGERGRVLPAGCALFAMHATFDTAPALARLDGLADTPRNRARMPAPTIGRIAAGPPVAVEAAAEAETMDHAIGRAVAAREAPLRAVTLADHEAIARATPGVRVARAIALPNLHPQLECVAAPGLVTVIVLPWLPRARPQPEPGFITRVAAWLDERRTIGTRIVVTGPRYLRVAVHARLKACPGADRLRVAALAAQAIDAFLDPLTGGPDGTGWPPGRAVYRAEIMQVIDDAAGVDHVLALDLSAEGCAPTCGNLCLRPTWLVACGQHHIEVT